MKSLAELKRRIKPGVKLTLLRHDRVTKNIGKTREVRIVQQKQFMLEDQSWLDWPKVSNVVFLGPNEFGFNVFGCRMDYRIESEG